MMNGVEMRPRGAIVIVGEQTYRFEPSFVIGLPRCFLGLKLV